MTRRYYTLSEFSFRSPEDYDSFLDQAVRAKAAIRDNIIMATQYGADCVLASVREAVVAWIGDEAEAEEFINTTVSEYNSQMHWRGMSALRITNRFSGVA